MTHGTRINKRTAKKATIPGKSSHSCKKRAAIYYSIVLLLPYHIVIFVVTANCSIVRSIERWLLFFLLLLVVACQMTGWRLLKEKKGKGLKWSVWPDQGIYWSGESFFKQPVDPVGPSKKRFRSQVVWLISSRILPCLTHAVWKVLLKKKWLCSKVLSLCWSGWNLQSC